MIESIPSFIGLIVLLIIVWAVAKFMLRLTARVIGCALSSIAIIGAIIILAIFFF